LNNKVILEGAWNGTDMKTTLLDNSVIPLSHPYNNSPWNYTGTESVSSVPADVVDWILIELRTGTDPATMVGQRAGFLLKDGSVVDLDGSSLLAFDNGLLPGDYYIVVRHRNHLAIMSAAAQPLSNASALYDFTTGQSQSYFDTNIGTLQIKELIGTITIWAMFGGDADADGAILPSDLFTSPGYFPQANSADGYYSSDWDMDTNVFPSDLFLIYLPNANLETHVPF
jgi:hypothetical protein